MGGGRKCARRSSWRGLAGDESRDRDNGRLLALLATEWLNWHLEEQED